MRFTMMVGAKKRGNIVDPVNASLTERNNVMSLQVNLAIRHFKARFTAPLTFAAGPC